jgi:uncharacterized membrane protein YcaP (DUF421 family)
MNCLKLSSRRFVTQFFVPKHDVVNTKDINKLKSFLEDKPKILILTGKVCYFNTKKINV